MRSCIQMWKHTLMQCLSKHAGCRTCRSYRSTNLPVLSTAWHVCCSSSCSWQTECHATKTKDFPLTAPTDITFCTTSNFLPCPLLFSSLLAFPLLYQFLYSPAGPATGIFLLKGSFGLAKLVCSGPGPGFSVKKRDNFDYNISYIHKQS